MDNPASIKVYTEVRNWVPTCKTESEMNINNLLKGLIDTVWDQYTSFGSHDASGESRNTWENLISSDCDYYPECDSSIQWTDITDELRDTPNNKAPGADGVPSEVWKL
ncbi:hypothetical protein AYI69_g8354, partial [Smittium culicis]